ncbi:hypothetical protein BDK51DRAFT_27491 [Blyttiomyces helicus]|uniref:Carbohydrate binding module family 10 domain-containing protein n=1 Tax=Blyttiomyces helicus TaxID=388810 RepID=A0A4P9W9S4_9FUNG|nr:hypothetical protein BDK51DRAFT_27491 [Blyttiomyces helicus]|eukprot:RKO88942.1 hypothetical protein BDK51DRAFT_27491 [Blyttiomyces helicus]
MITAPLIAVVLAATSVVAAPYRQFLTTAPPGTTIDGHPACHGYVSNPTYRDGYPWGRENGRDCIPLDGNYPEGHEPWNSHQGGGQGFKFGFPICRHKIDFPSIDKNGNQYGWENGKSCIVDRH